MSFNAQVASSTAYGNVKIGTGLSSTNGVISASTGILNYGFFTNGTQTNPVANTANLITLSNTGPANGISIVGTTAITVATPGVYTKSFTLIVNKTSGGTSTISIWLRYNGTDVPLSRQDLELTNTLAEIFVSGNFTLNMAAGSNIQMCWSSPDTTVSLLALPAAVAPTRPSGASAKVTLTRIS